MGSTLVVVSLILTILAAVPVALLWRDRLARLVVLGAGAFAGVSIAFQFLGALAAATGRPVVGAPGFAAASAVLCAASWGTRAWRRRRLDRPARDEAHLSPPPGAETGTLLPVALVGILAAVFLSGAVVSALSAPPRGWDVVTYHLPRAASWLLHGNFDAYGGVGAFYPGNAEFLILTLLFTGTDRLVPLVQIPFALLGGVAAYGIARRLGASRTASVVPAALLLLSPILYFQCAIAKDDLVVVALVLASAFLLMRSLDCGLLRTRLRDLGAAGLVLGLAVGTKYSILPYAALSVPVIPLLHVMVARRRPAPERLREAMLALGCFTAGLALPSVFWFVRNAALAGNPLEPLPVSLRGYGALTNLRHDVNFAPTTAHWLVFPWLDRHVGGSYTASAGYGAAFAAFFLPGLVLSLRNTLRRGLAARLRAKHGALLLLLLAAVTGWWLGKHHLPRFLWPAVVLALPSVALVFDSLRRGLRRLAVVLVVVAVAVSATETIRITYFKDDFVYSYLGGATREEHYCIPDAVYDLPTGTKILLAVPTDHHFYGTYRYPLVGRPPGNDVVMEDDYGVTINLSRLGPVRGHAALRGAGVEYVFVRFFLSGPSETVFDLYPDLYPRVLESVEESYPWYRRVQRVSPDGEVVGPGFVVTKLYRVAG